MAWTDVQPLAAARVVRDLLSGRSEPWVNAALRTRSPALPDVLTRQITGTTAAEYRDALLAAEGDGPELERRAVPAAGALATIWSAGASDTGTMVAGYRLFRAVIRAGAAATLTPRQRQIFAQVAFLLGEVADVRLALQEFRDIPDDVRRSLETDLLNPVRGGGDTTRWVDALSAPFAAAGLGGLSVRLDAPTLFDGLGAHAPQDTDGPLVSVIMPCYRPDAAALLTSVRSVLDQSHANLEVVLVDDASGADHAAVFEECEALDERVRLVRLAENGGTYVARNAALQEAAGALVTVQDADDWSHPSRIGDQVRALQRAPAAGGSRSDAIRATDDLLHQWVGYLPRRRNASSLMFRRSDLTRTGPFDAVRKGADSEFHERLERLVGPVVDTGTPLAITRLRSGTLSRSDFSYRWMNPDRLLYRAAYRSWHRTLTRGGAPPARPPGDVTRRPFPAPPAFVRALVAPTPPTIDVLVVLDGSHRATSETALALARDHGDLRFGVLHLEDATLGRLHQPEPVEPLLAAARGGAVSMLSPNEPVDVDVTVVLSPGVLELPPSPAPPVRTRRVVTVALPPSTSTGVMDFPAASDGAHVLLGRRPEWCALDEAAQRAWSAAGWSLPLLPRALRDDTS